MEPTEVVLAFVESVEACEDALAAEVDGAWSKVPAHSLTGGSGVPTGRHGHIEGLGAYRVHGYGCRFECDSGEQVDFDWTPLGEPTFDAWRLMQFARSRGLDLEQPELLEACRGLADAGVLVEHEWGFFTSSRAES